MKTRTVAGVVFTQDGTSPLGPGKGPHPAYLVKNPAGVQFRVSRHQWVLPTNRWAWKVRPVAADGGRDRYADTLLDVVLDVLGWPDPQDPDIQGGA
jgi:hypothetical protein